jgi:predicted ATPase
VIGLCYAAQALWLLGYPAQALERSQRALALARELTHPFTLAFALVMASVLHQFRREGQAVQERAEALMTLSTEHQFTFVFAWGTLMRGWAVAEQGQGEEGLVQIRQGLAAYQVTSAETWQPYFHALLTEACEGIGQREEGLNALAKALTLVEKNGERRYEAELYRLKGELTLQSKVQSPRSKVEEEAEESFQKAIEVARQQQAKSLELRAATSLARLWQQQGKQREAHHLLSDIYGWFTEGFDTKDLQGAKVLLEELSH